MGKGDIIASLDLGTSKICCMIGETTESLDIDILGYGISNITGIKKGVITDIDTTVQGIMQAVDLAEQMASIEIKGVIVGVIGGDITLLNNRGVVAIPRNSREITPQDVQRVLQAAKIMAIPYDRDIIDIIPREFIVDGCEGIKNPVGMVGTRLETSACIVTGLTTSIQNLIRCVEKAGLLIQGIVLKPLAVAQMLLTEDELEMGVAVVDIGAGTTDIAVIKDGSILAYDMIPIGGDFITNDLAIGLRIPFSQAEEIKNKYAHAIASEASKNKNIEVLSIGEKSVKKISQKDIAQIVEPRVQEIIYLIQKSLKSFDLNSMLPAGMVLTGGGLIHIEGAVKLAEHMLNLPMRFGLANTYEKEQTFTVTLALLYYGLRHNIFQNTATREGSAFGFIERARRIFKEYF